MILQWLCPGIDFGDHLQKVRPTEGCARGAAGPLYVVGGMSMLRSWVRWPWRPF